MTIKIALFVLMAAGSGVAGAEEMLNTQFGGWIGRNQHGYIMDPSTWHHCFSKWGGGCGTVGKTTGSSDCRTTGFNIGAKWAIPTRIGGMEVNASANRSWTACNIRSETVTCSPNVGYKGRAVVNFSARFGKMHVVGGTTHYTAFPNCAAGWKTERIGRGWRCTYVGGKYTVEGYLPEWRGSSCQYARN